LNNKKERSKRRRRRLFKIIPRKSEVKSTTKSRSKSKTDLIISKKEGKSERKLIMKDKN